MRYDPIYQLFLKGLLTDLRIILKDGFKEIIMDLHKIILIVHSPYFSKLLTFGKESDEITLDALNAEITRDLILTFYGQKTFKDWSYELSMTKARDYFGIETQIELPEKIDETDYDIILEICAIAGFDEDSIKNLPQNYDLKNLSREFVSRMIEGGTMHILTSQEPNCLKTWNIVTGELIHTMHHNEKISMMFFSRDRKFFVTMSTNECYLRETFNEEIIYATDQIVDMEFSHNNIWCAMAYKDGSLKIYDLLQKKFILNFDRTFAHTNSITFIRFSFLSEYLASGSNKTLKLWDTKNGQHLYTIETTCGIEYINFSLDASIITIKNTNNREEGWRIQPYANNICPIEILATSLKLCGYTSMVNNIYAAVKYNTGINIIDLKNNKILNFIDKVTDDKIIFSYDCKYVVVTKGSSVELYEVSMPDPLHSFHKATDIFTLDNKYFIVALNYRLQIFNLWDRTSKSWKLEFPTFSGPARKLKLCFNFRRTYHEHIESHSPILNAGYTELNDIMIYEMPHCVKIYNIATRTIINTLDIDLQYRDSIKIYSENAQRLLEIIE